MKKNRSIKIKLINAVLSMVILIGFNVVQVKAAEEWKSFKDSITIIDNLLSNQVSPENINIFIEDKYIKDITILVNKLSDSQYAISVEVNKHDKVSKLKVNIGSDRDAAVISKGGKVIFSTAFLVASGDHDVTFTALDGDDIELQKEVISLDPESKALKQTKTIVDKSNGGKPYTLQQLIEDPELFQSILEERIRVKKIENLLDVYIDFQGGVLKNTNGNMEYSLNSTNGSNGTFVSCATSGSETSVANLVPGKKLWIREKGVVNNFRYIEISKELPAPKFAIDYLNESTVEVIRSNIEYSTSSTFSAATSGNGTDKLDLTTYANNGATLYFRYKATSTTLPSKVFELKVPKRPAKLVITINYLTGRTVQKISSAIEYASEDTFTDGLIIGDGKEAYIKESSSYYFRTRATQSSFAGEVLQLETNGKVGGIPSFSIDCINETTKEVIPSTVEYSYDSEFKTGVLIGSGRKLSLTPGTNVYFRFKGISSAFPGEVFKLEIKGRPKVAYTIDYLSKTTKEIVEATDEYADDVRFTKNKTTGKGAVINLNPGVKEKKLYIRKKATATDFLGEVQELVIPALPAAPAYTIDFIDEKIYNIVDAYRVGDNGSFISSNNSRINLALTENDFGKNIYFKKEPIEGEQFESQIQVLRIPERPRELSYAINYSNATTIEVVPNTVEISESNNFLNTVLGGGIPFPLNPEGSAKTLYFRVRASQTNFRGKTGELYVPAATRQGPVFTINYSKERTNEIVSSNMEYAENENFTINKTSGASKPVPLTPGKSLYFRYKGGYNSFPSTVKELKVLPRPRVIEEFKIDFENEMITKSSGDLVDNKYQYAENPSFTLGVKNANEQVIEAIPGKNLYFRLIATEDSFASEVYEVMVPERPEGQQYTIDAVNYTTQQVIPTTVEYRIGNSNEADIEDVHTSGPDTLLKLKEEDKGKTIYFRIKATSDNFKSSPTEAKIP